MIYELNPEEIQFYLKEYNFELTQYDGDKVFEEECKEFIGYHGKMVNGDALSDEVIDKICSLTEKRGFTRMDAQTVPLNGPYDFVFHTGFIL